MVLRLGIVNCKSKLFTQFSKDWNESLWPLRREEVTNHSADWHFNSLLYSDVLLQLLLSLFCIWRMWGGFIVILIPSAFKHCKVSWPYCLIWFYSYNLINMFHKHGLFFCFGVFLLSYWIFLECFLEESALWKVPLKKVMCSLFAVLWLAVLLEPTRHRERRQYYKEGFDGEKRKKCFCSVFWVRIQTNPKDKLKIF